MVLVELEVEIERESVIWVVGSVLQDLIVSFRT